MKKTLMLFLIPLLLASCNKKTEQMDENKKSYADYGAFLGRIDNDVTRFSEYEYVSCELDEFGDSNINRLTNEKGVKLLAYLNVGSLENYRDYYEVFSIYTFKDYDNWPDERWIDITHSDWQDFVVNTLAVGFKNRQAYGVYLDNVDVYSVAIEEGKDQAAFAIALKNIIKGISNLGLKVLVNGGSEFIDDMLDENDSVINSIWGYHQEEVFSLIEDYEENIFTAQEKEDREYYQEISSKMKKKGKEIFYLEYTTDSSLKETIKNYCDYNQYHYYISDNINLP